MTRNHVTLPLNQRVSSVFPRNRIAHWLQVSRAQIIEFIEGLRGYMPGHRS